ncbi:MAG: glycosyltransferase [Betaproteobacteria bacterium]|nr:glycosyltransferase [Betaproteobacteria bacterium]
MTVYNTERDAARLEDMSYIRWFKISAALAALGHEVDIATAEHKFRLHQPIHEMGPGLRRVPLSRVRWGAYDCVKTLFHQGFTTLTRFGGGGHRFVISKLGSVVGSQDTDGIYFYGRQRRHLFATQRRIAATSRYVTVLSEPARQLWIAHHGREDAVLLVPGAADRDVPPRGEDPYPDREPVRCLFAGNVYTSRTQATANRVLIEKLNRLGALLDQRGARLYVLGPGNVRMLDPRHVTYLGSVSYHASWNYLQHAHVGVLVAPGPFLHNNESTKIYHYLRVGLPIVTEAGYPNEHLVTESGLGHIVANGDLTALADRAAAAAAASWDREKAVAFILARHTWDTRAAVYDRVLRAQVA